MGRINLSSRISYGSLESVIINTANSIDQPIKTTSDVVFNSGTITSNFTINGDLLVKGSTTTLETRNLIVEDNTITINSTETSAGVSAGSAGISVNRGSLPSYEFVFDEATDTFRIGQIGSLQPVATREDTPLDKGIALWNNTTNKFITTTTLPLDILFTGSNSTSLITGAIRTPGLAITGDTYSSGTLNLSNSSSSNVATIYASSTGSLEISYPGNFNINGIQSLNIPTNTKFTFGTTNEYIKYDTSTLSINSSVPVTTNNTWYFNDSTNTPSSSSGSIVVSGSIGLAGYLSFQNYSIYSSTLSLDHNNGNGSDSTHNYYTYLGDGTQNNSLNIYSLGKFVDSNSQHLSLGYNTSNSSYDLSSKKSGSGIILPISINNSQTVFNSNGTVTFGSTNASTSPSSASIVSSSISLSNTTDAISTTSGGSLTTAGGIAVAKAVYIGTTLGVTGASTLAGLSATTGIFSGAVTITGTSTNTGASTFASTITSTLATASTTSATGSVILSGGIGISNTVDAVSSTNGGSLTTAGGMAIAKSLYIGSSLSVTGQLNLGSIISSTSTIASTSPTYGSLLLSGGVGINCTSDASSNTNGGSLTTAGGMAVGKSLYVGNNLISTGTATFLNNTSTDGVVKIHGIGSTVSSNSTFYSDPVSTILSGSGSYYFNYFNAPTTTIPTSYSGVASTVYIAGAPTTVTGGIGYAINVSSGNSIFGGNVNILGIISSTNTTASSSASASIVTLGGITSKSTTNSVSETNGGSLTVLGGAAVSKTIYCGESIFLNSIASILSLQGSSIARFLVNGSGTYISSDGLTPTFSATSTINAYTDIVCSSTSNSVSSSTGSIRTSGGIYVQKDILANTGVTFLGSQNYKITTLSNNLSFNNTISDTVIDIHNGLDNGSLNTLFNIYSSGYNTSNTSRLDIGYSSSSSRYIIKPVVTGTGTLFPLELGSNQIVLNTDSSISLNITTSSTSSSTGSILIAGSISIANTSDSVSTSNGGSLTTAGGIAIGKTLYSKNIVVSSTQVSTSYNNGSLVVAGSIATPTLTIGTATTQNYFIGSINDNFYIQSAGNASVNLIGNSANIKTFSLGSSSTNTNNSYLLSGYNNLSYNIQSFSSGTGVLYPINISSGTSSINLNSNGITTLSSTIHATSTTASLLLSGGLTITDTTNSTSLLSPSSFYTEGGAIIKKDIYSGGDITLSSSSPKVTIFSSNAGSTAISHTMNGLELISNDNDISNAYIPGIKFLSASSSFTSTNPKMVGLIVAKATENYLSDISGGADLEFYSSPNNVGTNTLPSLRLILKHDGQIYIPGTIASTSGVTGTILTLGGITTSCTINSISETNGGGLTVLGGAAISKDIYIGGKIRVNSTENAVGGSTGAIQTPGGAYIGKDLYVEKSININKSTQLYTFTSRTTPDISLLLKSGTSNTDTRFDLCTADQDGTDNIEMSIYALGGSQITNYERLTSGYNNIDNKFRIGTNSLGSGVARDLVLYTASNSTQLVLNSNNGSISMGCTVSSISSTTGALKMSGGLSIATTVDATSGTVGGALTVAGGVAIGGKLYTSGQVILLNSINSTSNTTGSLIISGGLGITSDTFSTGKVQIKTDNTSALSVLTSGSSNIFTIDSVLTKLNTSCEVTINNTTNSSSTSSGSLHTLGGIGLSKDLIVGGKIIMNGTSPIDMNNNYINNLHDPIASSDAATKAYVDSVASGFIAKASCQSATTGPGTLASSFQNGNVIDGYTLVTGDRVLIKNQTNAVENGIYTVNISGSPTRSADLSTGSNASGALVFINIGTINGGTSWQCATTGAVIVGTDPIYFVQYSGNSITAGDGLSKNGNVINVNVDATTIEIFSDTLRLGSGAAGTGLSGGGGTALSVNSSQTQITALGTIGTGVWQASAVTVPYGGTGASTFTSGRLLFGSGASPIATSSNLYWDNTNISLGINTSSPDPTAEGDGLTIVNKDISLKTTSNTTGLSSILFQNSSNNYNWRIYRSDAGSGNAHLIFSSGNGVKSSLTSTVLGLSSSGNVSIGLNPASNTDKFYVNGNSNLAGNLNVSGSINAGNSIPLVNSFSSAINLSSGPSAVYSKMNLNGTEVHLWLSFSITPSISRADTEFQFNLPNISTDIGANRYYVNAQISGWTDDTNLTVLQNILCTGVPSTNKAIIKFQSAGTGVHIVQVYLRYTAN